MPMVPSFQGNVPRVRDSGVSGMVAAQQVRPQMDYASVMKEALKPINDAAQTVTEVLKINHARTVKAESDDADNRAMAVADQLMYDPENGYMAKQGKNAMEAYQSTMENLKAEFDKIVGGLQPATRDAVASRIADRYQSALRQATQWNARQTQAYHEESLLSHKASLNQSVGNNYGNEEFIAKTWASIQQDNESLAKYKGLSEEGKKLLNQESYDELIAARYAGWAQDDATGAYAHFITHSEELSPQVRQKISNALLAQSQDSFAMMMAMQEVQYDDKGKVKNLSWMDNPLASTGIAAVDAMPKENRLATVLKARQYRNSFVSVSESEFDSSIKNQYAKLRLGQPQEQYTKDDFIRRYGPVKGEKEYSTYLSNYAQNSAYWTFGELPDQDIYAALKAFKPDPKSPDFTAEQQKNYEALVKSADEIVRERKKDPAQFAIDRGMYGFERIDVKNETQLLQGLKNRSDSLSQMKDQWDLKNPRILSADEQKELTEYISQIEPAKQLEFIRKLGAATGRDAGEVLAAQMSDKYGLALTLDLDNFAGSENSAFYYLTGSQAIEEGQPKVKDIETNKTDGRPEYIESLNGLFDDPDLRTNVADTVTGVAAGILVSGKTSSMRTAFRQAEKLVIGDVYEFRGRKIFTRNGRSDANVRERIFSLRNKLKSKKENVVQLPNKQKLTGEQFARDLATAQLRNSPDDNKFYVISGSGVVYDLQGNPFVIDIGG